MERQETQLLVASCLVEEDVNCILFVVQQFQHFL